jgi:hypothetical protein
VATGYNLYRTIGNINVYTESELLEVKVPLDFLGTVGFSLRREGLYPTCGANLIWFGGLECTRTVVL